MSYLKEKLKKFIETRNKYQVLTKREFENYITRFRISKIDVPFIINELEESNLIKRKGKKIILIR